MISNNSSVYKLKASKSSKDIQDSDYAPSDDNYENNSIEEEAADSNHRLHSYSRDSKDGRFGRGAGRSRSTEFRPSKASDRRGGYRGRGGGGSSGRRGDRDYADNFYNLKKYDSGRNSESSGGYRGKCYEPEKKSEIKLNLPEDTRISKLLRRLSTETSQDNSLTISKKLLEVLLLPDNMPYVRKAFHILGDSMYEILHVSPGPLAKLQAAKALGRMGYIMGQENDFDRYQHWLFSKMNNNYEEMQILLMKTFKETLALEAKKPVLECYMENLINNLVSAIETTENAEVFKVILDVLMSVVELYPNEFYEQFRDTTDLLFGWHVDHTQPLSTIEFISTNLQRVSQHFKYNLEFSVSLIQNFLEDIINYAAQVNDTGDGNSLDHVTVLILAMNTVLKCLDVSFHPSNNKFIKAEFVNTCLVKIVKTLTDALESFVPDNLTIAANDCISILIGYLDAKPQSLCTSICNLIDLELALIVDLSDNTIISMLLLIVKVIKELSANLPIELIEKLIGPKSEIIKLRHIPFKNIQEAVICIYQALLNLKNVSLLQEAYRYVLGDLEVIYKEIVPSIEPFTPNNPFIEFGNESNVPAEQTVMFLLRCLSQLASASSIIVMWALKPSILELVGVNLKPYDVALSKNYPSLQYCLLFLLYSHCRCYSHFISNSSLVTNKPELSRFTLSDGLNLNDVPNTSPNSGNFAIILDIIYNTLKIETSFEVTLLILQWLNDILINSEIYLESLYLCEKFLKVTDVLVKCGYHFNSQIVCIVCENLEKLLSNKSLSWSSTFLTNICELCKLYMNSNNEEIRNRFSALWSNIPWDIAIVELNKVSNIYNIEHKTNNSKDINNYMIYLAQSLHLNGSVEGEMYAEQFKVLMNYLIKNEHMPSGALEELFTCCWQLESDCQMNMELYYDLAMNSRQVLNNWCTLEAAQFCVNYKLRTPLGKPNETFTKIEGALNQLGNDLLLLKKNDAKPATTDGNKVRLLLHFVEHLEKSIYNAAEGTAIAIPPPSKVVRNFFIANTNTCKEWLSRIRMVVMHTSLHAGEASIALRHGQCLLKDLSASGNVDSVEFERLTMFLTLALLNLKEPEALCGLYVWCKIKLNKKYAWIKCAADQASKKYEIAVEGYKKFLTEAQQESADKKMDQDLQNFINDQILVCYKELNNWVDLFEWHDQQEGILENGKKYWFNTTDWECNKNMYNMEVENRPFIELSTWKYKNEEKTWSVFDNLNMTETNLHNIAVSLVVKSEEDCITKIDKNLKIIQKSIQDHLILAPSEFLQNYSLLEYVAIGLKNVANNMPANTVFLVSENFENEINKIDSSILRKILWWSEYFGNVQNQGFNAFCSNLRLDIIKRARKEKNFKLAITNIFKFFKDKNYIVESSASIGAIANDFLNHITGFEIWNVDTARAILEVIKLSYCHEDSHVDTFNLCASASTAISKYAEMFGIVELRKISSKILIKLAGWLQMNENVTITDMNSPLGKLIMVLPEIAMMENVSSIIPLNEMAIGKLLQFSVHQCLGLAKGWNAFGTWCYRWGRRIVDHSSDIKNNLTEEHCLEIKKLLPLDISEEDLTNIFLILSQTRTIIDEEDIDSNEINTSDMIKNQLMGVSVLKNASEEQLRSMVQIWKSTQKRIYNYYSLSAEAYFKYLHLAMNPDNASRSAECNTITITLRLLRLIVKYALELQNILEEGLQSTPTQPWKVIIPQLFSRLNHPESYVRHRVSDLLCRVAEDAPQLITFPAVVGALEGGLKFDFSEITLPKDCLSQNNEGNEDNELNEDDENYESDSEESTNTLQSCFKTMVDTLSKQDPETIAQVQLLVKELRRITLLWDELWLGTLAQHQSEISKRQQQLEYEIEKVNENSNLSKEEKISLIAEKHRIIIKPIVFILEQLLDVTSVEAETPHEKQFQEKYLDHIRQVIYSLKNPDHPEKPEESLQPLRLLQKKFQQKFHKRASYSLKMQDISPVLHTIKNTVIAMPGLATSGKQNVTISHVSNTVSILPTKTKPKKLVFYGSDGQTYTYLFKGLEDLHLDERIMQFLSIANTMMAQNSDPSGNNLYRARHYSVIPLGPRSGLISWVDGTTPVFALYKRWQQREIAKPNPKGSNSATTSVLRPSELFYNKLNPLLREHGVKNPENRKEWPLAVLKRVLAELMAETPGDLLARELWCNSISPNVWWQVTRRYSYSAAVMSAIGYIIGLGDRHLDNVLVDLASGDVVHIDYNVCFEKGKTLRVPEKVPFRLTPNIREALGATGVEGIFRVACENVLKAMRKGRETLLTLLEAFVYDPLIDWTVGGEVLAGTTFGGLATNSSSTRQSKKELEREVTLSMFNVRCTEMRVEWNENRNDVLAEIPNLISNINHYIKQKYELDQTEEKLQDLHQQLALVKEAEAQGSKKHSLFKLPTKYDSYMKSQEVINVARSDLEKMIKDCELHLELYNNLMVSFEKQQFAQWMLDLKMNMGEDCLHIFELVKEFLHNAGKDDVVVLCEQSEQEVIQLSQHLNIQTRKCIQIFQDYFSFLIQCPKNYMDSHRMQLFPKWARHMLDTKSIDSYNVVIENFKEFLSSKHLNAPQIVTVAFTLDSYYKETLLQVNKLFEDLATLRTKEPNDSLEKQYNSAKIGISNFLQSEKGSVSAMKFVIAGELIILNRNFITLEVTAHRAGDWLIKLMSREGDWFLDDLLLHSTRAVELISNIPARQDTDDHRFYQICNGIRVTNNIYKGLYDLNFNFHTIILPESFKKIVADEESVSQMIFELNQLIIDIGVPIPEIIMQLEKLLTCVLIQMDVSATYDYIVERVLTAKAKFAALIPNQSETLSQGKMLLMGFNGLFEKLTQEVNNMINVLSNLDIPKSWKKLDHVKDAKNIAPHIFNIQVRNILDNMFFLKKIKVMSEFFAIAKEMCQTMKGVTTGMLYKDEQLTKPVKQFTSEFVLRQVLGIAPEVITYSICSLLQQLEVDVTHEIEQKDIGAEIKVPLDELYQKAFSILLKENKFTSNVISQANSLETNLKVAWEKIQEPKKIEQKVTILQSSLLRMQNLLTVHNLMFDEVLICHSFASVRTKLLADMQSELAALQAIYNQLAEAKEKQQNLVEKAHQRLNWAKGANPNVGEISAAFGNAIEMRDKKLNLEQKIASCMLTSCSVVLQYEFLRITSVDTTKEYDKIFLNYADKWRMAIQYMDYKSDNLSLSEVGILNLLSPELVKDPRWLQKISEHITEMITNLQKKLAEQKETLVTNINNSLLSLIDNFKAIYNVHLKLMSDVKSLVKTMTKIEDYSYVTQKFVQEYRVYIDHFSSLFVQLKKEPTREVMEESLKHLDYLRGHTEMIYAGLLDLEVRKGLPSQTSDDSHDTSLVKKQESVTKGQQRNAYAVNVWRRVKMKLEGRDPDPGRKCTAQEQVDYIIREATSLDNLALLYEGWTPWV